MPKPTMKDVIKLDKAVTCPGCHRELDSGVAITGDIARRAEAHLAFCSCGHAFMVCGNVARDLTEDEWLAMPSETLQAIARAQRDIERVNSAPWGPGMRRRKP